MSMHNKPVTETEATGLRAHGLKIGVPSQLSDCFRQGVAWGEAAERSMPKVIRNALISAAFAPENQSRQSSELRAAAITLFGEEAVLHATATAPKEKT